MGLEPPTVLIHWVAATNVMRFLLLPRLRAYRGASKVLFRQTGAGYELALSHASSSVSKRSGASACGLWLASGTRTYVT